MLIFNYSLVLILHCNQMFIIISVIVAVFTAPINLIVDYLFHGILLAPTADSLKIQKSDNSASLVARRMSNAGFILCVVFVMHIASV